MRPSKAAFCFLVFIFLPTFLFGKPSYGRVAKIRGDLLILRPSYYDWEYASRNDIVEEGTRLRTRDNSFAEIETEKGIRVYMDEETQMEFETIDKDESVRELDVIVFLTEGRVVGRVPKKWRWDLYLSIKTYTTEVILPEKAISEVETYPSGRVYVRCIEERIQVRTRGEVVYLEEGEELEVDPDGYISYRSRWEKDYDSFEDWCDFYREPPPPPSYIPVEIEIAYWDLAGYGDWIYVPGYGYVWRPYVEPWWRPYYCGHWTFTIAFGWVWVPYEPWGWVPFHYGYWTYAPGWGWVWIPGPRWGPGWVVWEWGPDWVGWCPLGPYGRPVFYSGLTVWTYVEINSFKAPRYRYKPPRKPVPDPYYRYKKPRDYKKPGWVKEQPPVRPDIISPVSKRRGAGRKVKEVSGRERDHRFYASKTEGKVSEKRFRTRSSRKGREKGFINSGYKRKDQEKKHYTSRSYKEKRREKHEKKTLTRKKRSGSIFTSLFKSVRSHLSKGKEKKGRIKSKRSNGVRLSRPSGLDKIRKRAR
jgi:hypothetical protein